MQVGAAGLAEPVNAAPAPPCDVRKTLTADKYDALRPLTTGYNGAPGMYPQATGMPMQMQGTGMPMGGNMMMPGMMPQMTGYNPQMGQMGQGQMGWQQNPYGY